MFFLFSYGFFFEKDKDKDDILVILLEEIFRQLILYRIGIKDNSRISKDKGKDFGLFLEIYAGFENFDYV